MSVDKIEIWKDRISKCKASGIPVKEWCYKNGLTTAKYYYWHKVINPLALHVEKPVFAEVFVSPKPSTYQGVKISCKDVDISLSNANDISLVVQFIQELQKHVK